MDCQIVLRSISPLLDSRLRESEAGGMFEHIGECRHCAAKLERSRQMRAAMLEMPAPQTPGILRSRLMVLASRDRARRILTLTPGATLRYWAGKAHTAVDRAMRPLAVPLAGGLTSAFLLFSMLMPTLGGRPYQGVDVPTSLYTEATLLATSPFSLDQELVIELTIDERGQVADYSLPQGALTPAMAGNIGNLMLFTSFTPATWFGQPTSGKILVSFRRSRIVVKG